MLDNAQKVIEWTKTMTWKGINPVVKLIEDVYEKGVKLTKKAFSKFDKQLIRNQHLPKIQRDNSAKVSRYIIFFELPSIQIDYYLAIQVRE